MKFIGITGGVGAGKSTIMAYLSKNYRVRTLVADEIAHDIMEPGNDCYVQLQKEFSKEKIWLKNGRINRQRLSDIIFRDEAKRNRLNAIVHPAVKDYIIREVEKERRSGSTDYVVLEAALLIEEGYDRICDELWYVYATEENRRKRLMDERDYSEEKVADIFAAQLPDGEYRRHCQVIIDNNGPQAQAYLQLAQLLREKVEDQEEESVGNKEEEKHLVFGLDIGTRNVVGTVGYKEDKEFVVIAQYSLEHETRAMLDGQIHDIGRVGRTIAAVKQKLEEQIGRELTEVCIAAAGRVLKTVTTDVEFEFPEETVVTREHIHTLDLLGVDKAYQELKEKNDTKYKFYCVGYSVMKYYINDEIFSNLESHKADKISEKIIVTFLPEDVVDGLYMAVGFAGLTVANLTLEPIAAIDVAIPENYRMLNIALVDVGAGTSDICVTRDGSIIAYGMIPFAGDELTETIVQHYLVDFQMAEHIKLSSGTDGEIEFEDIMSLKHTIPAEEVWKLTEPLVDKMSEEVASKIMELNGDKTVSATFIVGGGGKIHDFDVKLAEKLDLPKERVALRGEEVLKEVTFLQDDIKKDPLLVTPIGICLNYYEQKNNFIMVHFNGERIKLYDNSKLTIVDAAMQAGFPNDQLFPKRGREINFTVNGRPRIIRGGAGESAIVRMNDRPASINDPIEPNCYITIEPSTEGQKAHYTVGELDEYQGEIISFEVNGRLINCPRYVEVNGVLEPPTYEIQEGDVVVTRGFYTVEQLAEFMDVELDPDADILVNNRVEGMQALVYENFSVDWKVLTYRSTPQDVYQDDPAQSREPDLDSDDGGEVISATIVASLPDNRQGIKQLGLAQDGGAGEAEPERSAVENLLAKGALEPDLPGMEDALASAANRQRADTGQRDGNAGSAQEAETGQGDAIAGAPGMEAGQGDADAGNVPETDAGQDRTPAPGAQETYAGDPEQAGVPNVPEFSTAKDRQGLPDAPGLPVANGLAEAPDSAPAPVAAEPVAAERVAAESGSGGGFPVTVNGKNISLQNKESYIFVDVFDYIHFNLSEARGRMLATEINGREAQYTQELKPGDRIDIYWKED